MNKATLIEELREEDNSSDHGFRVAKLMRVAADRIEALEAEIKWQEGRIINLAAAVQDAHMRQDQ
jgi:hypothetical protein